MGGALYRVECWFHRGMSNLENNKGARTRIGDAFELCRLILASEKENLIYE
jgi:hypothetical protein